MCACKPIAPWRWWHHDHGHDSSGAKAILNSPCHFALALGCSSVRRGVHVGIGHFKAAPTERAKALVSLALTKVL